MAFMIESLEEKKKQPPPSPYNVLVLTMLYILYFF